ncbi:UDP-4-amino-4,6-dideoxy-N-acetyl-beta-L-altrosamine transaminase [Exilibacterium tricleocarpae]|uniref:UDP-4-amino-4, 6-dideoxy-N-acetyl-beta-L-altrosamine transaminase n=1 Tax=Exilibacterium tricleocarpae TaxID=2591008 RepID=A0A545U3W5_9GAMM|nr:UDP-4-amino-4,6-dideoxy-N-acetyl-beta-L-altrosamine transaminase [Exilibacterium tricleocarpae]TQV84146.1 UDP-4-amino-4,6-dideoxy-N-acetyl-beta-L-altrosamine transaminase [Exilibacterium tricleocarpae]
MIPYGRQTIDEADIAAVVAVLRSDWLTQGPAVPRFEQHLAAYCGAEYGVAASSGTAALHLACRALGLGAGDWLWTSPLSFVASANCARYCGARVDFVDIDPATRTISVAALEDKLHRARRAGRLPKVVVPVHFAGVPCDMPALAALAETFGFRILEDAAHALGSRYGDCAVGACRHSDITVFSFHPVKTLTTGEGGMAVCNDPRLAAAMRKLCSHGITRDPADFNRPAQGDWYYEQQMLGYNYRMTDIQAALGLAQLDRLPAWIERRCELANRYAVLLQSLPLQLPSAPPQTRPAWHIYPIALADSTHRLNVFNYLRQRGIGVNVHYIPIHLQPDYQRFGFGLGDFINAEAYYGGALTLPLYPALTADQQDQVVACLREALL